MKVAIVGGGIGGLTAALALRAAGHDPLVFERTTSYRPVGAGISLWPNGIKALASLGLGEAVAALGGRMDRMSYADHTGRTLTDFSLVPLYERVGERAWPVARAALQSVLLDALGADRVRTGACCTEVDPAAGTVHFADGSSVRADLVVGADGTHSALRHLVAGAPVARRYAGYVNWNGIVDADPSIAPPDTWLTWVGAGMRASVMPVGGGRLYWFFDVPLPADALGALASPADILPARFSGWAPAVQALLGRALDGPVTVAPIYDIDPLDRFSAGRLVLIGDAAHAMAPDLGQGGCQAMEDAVTLARCLGSDDPLGAYDQARVQHTASIVRRARKRADRTHGADMAETEAWYAELAVEDGQAILDGLAQSVETGAMA